MMRPRLRVKGLARVVCGVGTAMMVGRGASVSFYRGTLALFWEGSGWLYGEEFVMGWRRL